MVDEPESYLDDHEERRRYDRSRLLIDVHFDGRDATGVASTKDISVGGLYMNTQAQLPEGSILLIRIPIAAGKQVVATAQVVYCNEGRGVGLRFLSLPDNDRTLLESELENV